MLRFMEGFDQLKGFESVADPLTTAGYTVAGTVALGTGRTDDARCLIIGDDKQTASSVKRTFSSTAQKVVLGFAYEAGERANIVTITNVGTLAWSVDTAKVSIAGGTGTASILLGLWYYYEIVIDKANQLVQLYINNTLDIEAPLPAAAQNLNTFETVWSSADGEKKLDDIAFIDSTQGKYVDRIGPIAIQSRLPSTDQDRDWSPATGVDHYAMVDNMPPKDGEYIQSNTSGAIDTFLSSDGIPTGSQVLAVGITAYAKKSDIDNRQLGLLVGKKGSAQKEVVDTNLTTTSKYSYGVFETGPNDAAWTAENVTTIPFGVVVRP